MATSPQLPSPSPPGAPPAPTQDDRTLALLAHVLQIFTWWIGPLIIFLVKRESSFVKFHALQALIWQLTLTVFWIVCFVLFFASAFAGAAAGAGGRGQAVFPLFFLLLWLVMMSAWVVTLVLAIVHAIKASRGEWAEYPVIGAWARRFAGA